ncbi:hypothetical protein CJP46_32350 [Paenibacillus sp. XY044]|nr:DUF421 domain-containing protein [Paenibacillus sp. XY044]OZB90641.1 hypothetical protein CJP46_32350 [Paenibacillus sp. XY044]
MSDILIPIFRTVLMYFVIYLTLRIMGKREIGKLSIFDLVISIMIAEIGVFVLEDMSRPISDGLFPMATLVLIQITIAFLSLKSRKIRLLFEGKPAILVSGGKLNREEMRRHRYNLDDLLLQLRGRNIENVADVEFAILENSGQLTVIPKSKRSDKKERYDLSGPQEKPNRNGNPSTSARNTATYPRSLGMESKPSQVYETPYADPSRLSARNRSKKILVPSGKFTYGVLPIPLIMDGKVQDDNLERLNKNRFWLKNQIQQRGIKDFKDVFLCSIDHKGRLYIDRK